MEAWFGRSKTKFTSRSQVESYRNKTYELAWIRVWIKSKWGICLGRVIIPRVETFKMFLMGM